MMMGERGFLWPEVLVAVSIFLLLATVALPQGYNLWRRAALDYETTRLANDLRNMFRAQRLVVHDRAYFNTVLPQEADWFSLVVEDDGYRVENGKTNTVWRHKCLPGIRMAFRGSKTRLTVNKDGYTGANNTVVVYYDDGNSPRYGKYRYVIVDTAGRVRIDRRAP